MSDKGRPGQLLAIQVPTSWASGIISRCCRRYYCKSLAVASVQSMTFRGIGSPQQGKQNARDLPVGWASDSGGFP